MRAVSVLSVADHSSWALLDVEAFVAGTPEDSEREVTSERGLLDALEARGLSERVLIRYARRPATDIATSTAGLLQIIDGLPVALRRVLHAAQRHALDDIAIGLHAWDPEEDGPAVRGLVGAGLMMPNPSDSAPYTGPYRLHPDLPQPQQQPYDFSEAVMDLTDDLSEQTAGPIALLHDMASLAAALHHVTPRRTHAGTIGRTCGRKLGRRLGAPDLTASGQFDDERRWSRALRALEALGAVSMAPLTRRLHLELGLENTLSGTTAEAIDRLVHRLVDRDQHVLLPAVRAALGAAGTGAIDVLIFAELLQLQHRDVLFPAWRRAGQPVYPHLEGEAMRPYDAASFEAVEQVALLRLLRRIERLGLIRQEDVLIAATADGRVWASATDPPRPPVWVSSDLEFVVPPGAVTPWERFQLERLGRCLARDVVDRYLLEQKGCARGWSGTILRRSSRCCRGGARGSLGTSSRPSRDGAARRCGSC